MPLESSNAKFNNELQNDVYGIYNSGSPQKTDEPTANLTYLGWSHVGSSDNDAVWRIMRMEKSGTTTTIYWADGNQLYDNIWSGRTTINYF